MKTFTVIVAGGSGTRMGTDIPKQFLELSGKPILMHTIAKFHEFDFNTTIIVVLPKSQFAYWKELCKKYNFHILHKVVSGGTSRFQSVKNGLNHISDEGIVFIHDGVRPLVSNSTIKRCLDMAIEKGNALPVVPVVDSIRKLNGEYNEYKNRADYCLVQTPQTFAVNKIKTAFQQDELPTFTDDASVLEAANEIINLVEGNTENIKITTKTDWSIAGVLIQNTER
ncbi:MAG: 2-C-methyl-D-erythritol 4-phosphate cytidylyltransferase [Mangrovibacterium sp.]